MVPSKQNEFDQLEKNFVETLEIMLVETLEVMLATSPGVAQRQKN